MNIITIDFETYYDQQFSLSKLTTEEYIRGDQFEVVGVAVKVGDGETEWFSGTKENTKKFLEQFDFPNNIALAHNAMFDGAILSWYFGISPKGWIDTLSMARALHTVEVGGSLSALAQYYELGQKGTEVIKALGKRRLDFSPRELSEYGAYCVNDVDLTYRLFLVMKGNFPKVEFRLVDLTLRMFTEPVLELDKELLEQSIIKLREDKEKLLAEINVEKKDLMSNDKFANVLISMGVQPPIKISNVTGREAYAFSKTDDGFKELLDHPLQEVQVLAAARVGLKSTLEESRTQRFIEIAERGALPIPLRYYAAHTGRWGGDDKVNMQNLPRTSQLKQAICAPSGYKIIDSDSSQIEARTVAWLAGQDDLLDAFAQGKDVYKLMASEIYNKDEKDVSKSDRFVGKTTILGAGYGMGGIRFQAQLRSFGVDVPMEEAMRIIQVYRETYPSISQLWKSAHSMLEHIEADETAAFGRNGILVVEGSKGIRLPNGFHLKYPNLRRQANNGREEYVYDTKRGKSLVPTRIYGGKIVENCCQALARIIIGDQMLNINKKYKVVMTVHDAVACVVPEHEVEEAQKFVETCMKTRPDWAPELPLNCESGYGDTYGEC